MDEEKKYFSLVYSKASAEIRTMIEKFSIEFRKRNRAEVASRIKKTKILIEYVTQVLRTTFEDTVESVVESNPGLSRTDLLEIILEKYFAALERNEEFQIKSEDYFDLGEILEVLRSAAFCLEKENRETILPSTRR